MRNLALIFTALIFGALNASAVTLEDKVALRNAYGFNNSFIFVEGGITFSVYPDGEFDFYIDQVSGVNANVNFRNTNITFNSGFNYNPFVQYDDYGAVIQVENIPVYYDFYGRVTQVGNVDIRYNNGRIHRLGGMSVYYNRNGFYSHHSGFINIYNRNYVYAPFHGFFVRPALNFCLVYDRPYRRFYNPVRYSYYAPYYNNSRVIYANIGREHRYDNNVHQRRANVYRNDNRVAVRENSSRRTEAYRTNSTVNRNATGRSSNIDRNSVSRNDYGRSNTSVANRTSVSTTGSNREATGIQRNSSLNRSDANSRNTAANNRTSMGNNTVKSENSSVQRNATGVRSDANRSTAPVSHRTSVNTTANKSRNVTAPRSTEANRSNSNVVRKENRNSSPAPKRTVSERPAVSKGSHGSSTISSRSAAPKAESRVSSSNTRSKSAATQRSSSARRSQ